jgi:hypothetical protein
VFAISTGPNGRMETGHNQVAADNATAGGDDIVARVK